MRKNCSTCLYSGFGQCHFDDCKRGKNGIPTKWVPAPFWTQDTNADRIRAMSDEELAEYIDSVAEACYNAGAEDLPLSNSNPLSNAYNILEWLKQPAEE